MIPFKNGCHVTSPMGLRTIPELGIYNEYHRGMDMVPLGDDSGIVISPFYGTVAEVYTANPEKGRGFYVVLTLKTKQAVIFQHLDSVSVEGGMTVSPGTSLGKYGNTGTSYGAHLHIEAWKDFDAFKANDSSGRNGLLPVYDLIGISNAVGDYTQNYDYDIITNNPLITLDSAEPWTILGDSTDKLKLPLSREYGTYINFDKSKYTDLAIVVGEDYLQGYAESIELKESTSDTSATLKLSFLTEVKYPNVTLGDYIKAYSQSSDRIVFYGRISNIEKSTSKISITAKNRMYYLSKSDMTVQFTDGQNTGDAIRSLCNKVGLSHRIARFTTTISSSMIFYKDNLVSILKKLIQREEEFTGKEYFFYYDYAHAMLVVEEKGKESYSVSLSDFKDISKSRSIDDVRNVVSGYDSSAKTAKDPIIDEESINKYGTLIYYYTISDGVLSSHYKAYLEKHKEPLTSGSLTLSGSFWARPGMRLVLPDTSPVSFENEGTIVIDSITHKIGEEHEMQLSLSEYKAAEVPTLEEVVTFEENSVLNMESEQRRLKWGYFNSFYDLSTYLMHSEFVKENDLKLNMLLSEGTIPQNNELIKQFLNEYGDVTYIKDKNGVFVKASNLELCKALGEAVGIIIPEFETEGWRFV